MSTMIGFSTVLLGVAFIISIALYNHLIGRRNQIQKFFYEINGQLRRRHELTALLVEAIRPILVHDRETIELVQEAKKQAVVARARAECEPHSSNAIDRLTEAEIIVTDSLTCLIRLVEQNPFLLKNDRVRPILDQLFECESKIPFTRSAYNDGVYAYNHACQKLPNLLVAQALGFQSAYPIDLQSVIERGNPNVTVH